MNVPNATKNYQPEDFIKNYSSYKKADLIIDVRYDIKKKVFNEIFSKIINVLSGRDYMSLKNDLKIYKTLNKIKKIKDQIDSDSIIEFLVEKFSIDHLRKFEYPFQAKCLLRNDVDKSIIVDIGGNNSFSSIVATLLNFNNSKILSIDILNKNSKSFFGIEYIRGSSIDTNLPNNFASVVSIISTLEHIGLGRWGDKLDPEGDIKTMVEIRRILKIGGSCILTVPYGFPTVVFNLHRIYDDTRLKKLIDGFEIVVEEYSLLGKTAQKNEVINKKVTKNIKGFYQDHGKKNFNSPSGIMLLLKKK